MTKLEIGVLGPVTGHTEEAQLTTDSPGSVRKIFRVNADSTTIDLNRCKKNS